MFNSVRGRLLIILAALAVSIGYLVQNYRNTGSLLKLGLDLRGGMHVAVEIADPDGTLLPETKAAYTDQALFVLRTRIDQFGVEEPIIQKAGSDRIIVQLAGVDDEERAKEIIGRSAFLEFRLVQDGPEFQGVLSRLDRAIITALGEEELLRLGTERRETSSTSITELFGQQNQGDTLTAPDSALADPDTSVTAAQDSAQATADSALTLRPFTQLLRQGDAPGTFQVAEQDREVLERFMALPEFQRALPRDTELRWGAERLGPEALSFYRLYILEDEAFITGAELDDAVAGRDPQFNNPQVQFELNRLGGRRFSQVTGQHIGDYIAIVLDGEVMSAPVIEDRIGRRGQINLTGSPLQEAQDLALVLRAGALPASLEILEERTVGPSLGQDSVDQGQMAGTIGLVLVLLVMISYYRMAGVLAVSALAVYVVLVMGGMAAIDAKLTLPGLAGLVLSIGMAVDANVLIFERIREELAAGRASRTAVDEGFGNALSAIVDANLTTLITALILYQFGTGPVQGFAVTLSIGIVASFFSALYVTRTFFLMYLSGKKASDPVSI